MENKKLLLVTGLGGIGKVHYDSERIVLNLMKLRNRYGLTQNQLAKKINVANTTISRIENFTMQPTLKMVLQILDVYGMTLDIVAKKELNNSIISNELRKEEHDLICSATILHDIGHILTEFNKKHIFNLNNNETFGLLLSNILITYANILKNNGVDLNIIEKVNRFERYTNLILREYYSGQHNLAYELFKEMIRSCINIDSFIKEMPNDTVLYRARKKNSKEYKENEMYHIPFEQRYKVRTQRYSYPGLPCLYLGGSEDVCESELNESASNLSIAKMVYRSNKTKYKLLDLTSIFYDYIINDNVNTENSLLLNIPLVLICSTKVNHSEKEIYFKEEHIFPQLLLEYIINETILDDAQVIGIKYFSVKESFIDLFVKKDVSSLNKICNYVFPARNTKQNEGICNELQEIFQIVEIK